MTDFTWEITRTPPPPQVLVLTVKQESVPIYWDWVATLAGFVNANIQPQFPVT